MKDLDAMALAHEVAERFLDEHVRPAHADEIVIARAMEFEGHWAFGYNTRAFLEDDDFLKSLTGNGPVVVPKDGQAPYLAGSRLPLEDELGPMSGFVDYLDRR